MIEQGVPLAASDYLGRFWFSAEPMFGVMMVICFTSVIRANPAFISRYLDLLIETALFCCLAWGIVDGVFYAWEAHYEAKKKNQIIRDAKQASNDRAVSGVDDSFADSFAEYLNEEERKQLSQNVARKLAAAEEVKVPLKQDLVTIGMAVLLVVGAAIVVLIPFAIVPDILNALLISNLAGILLLFFMGIWREESKKISKKLTTGLGTALMAAIITFVTVTLGG
jgi:VIT1/CCC1 family predicted Fe2+/Mn2+ transporter